jgi:hypothetical protein
MAGESVEIVRGWLDAVGEWMRSNAAPEQLATIAADFLDPDIEYHPVRKFPDAAPCHGLQELVRYVIVFRDTWEYEMRFEDMIAVGDDKVLTCAELRAEGRASGIELAGPIYQCFFLRDGRIVRQEDHVTVKGALCGVGVQAHTLEAAGLKGEL